MLAAKASYVQRYLICTTQPGSTWQVTKPRNGSTRRSVMKRATLLATVAILPGNELADIKRALAGLIMCRHADEIELEGTAWCRTCNFKPAMDPGVPDARRRIDDLDDQLDTLNGSWAAFIAKALEDPSAESSLQLLTDAEAAAVRATSDPDTLPGAQTVTKLNTVLHGLQRVSITADDLVAALRSGGPATVPDLEARLATLLAQATAGKNPGSVRLVIE